MVVIAFDRRHHLAFGRERDFGDALIAPFALFSDAQLALGHQKGRFGGVTVDLPRAARPLAQVGVAGQTATAEHDAVLGMQRPFAEFGVLMHYLSLGRVPHPGDVGATRGGHDAHNGHFAPGQGAGLVRGNNRGGAQRFHRRQILDDRVVLRHPPHPECQHHRQNRRQPLRHGRHREGHAEQQHVNDIGGVLDIRDQQDRRHDDHGNDDYRDPQHATDASDFLLQRRRLLRSSFEHLGDRTHLGGHPGRRHHGATGALRDGRALEDHVEPVADGCRLRQRGGILEDGFALARQRGLLHAQCCGLNQARIRTYGVTLVQIEQVAAHQPGAGHPQYLTVTQDSRGHGRHARQGGHGVLGLGFLHITEDCVEQDNRRDDDCVHRPADRALDHPGQQRDGNGAQQQVNQRILKMRQDAPPGRDARCRPKFVRTVLREPARHRR